MNLQHYLTDEKLELIQFVVEKVNKRVPVIAGTGSNNTAASIDLSQKAEALGVDALMIVTPYYNKPNQRGMIAHFEAIANATTLPIVVYNIPGRSVVNLEPESIVALSKIPSIQIVKEASGNLDQMTKILANTEDDFLVYSGDDALTLTVTSNWWFWNNFSCFPCNWSRYARNDSSIPYRGT